METKHTPGPWIVMRGGWTDEGFAQYELHGNRTSSISDARLIAAAPELLEVLEAAVRDSRNPSQWIDEARSAIAKAKGEA
jgi:hypothetical protein